MAAAVKLGVQPHLQDGSQRAAPFATAAGGLGAVLAVFRFAIQILVDHLPFRGETAVQNGLLAAQPRPQAYQRRWAPRCGDLPSFSSRRRYAGTAPASCAEVVLVAARPLLASAVSPPFRGETATSPSPAAPENRQD